MFSSTKTPGSRSRALAQQQQPPQDGSKPLPAAQLGVPSENTLITLDGFQLPTFGNDPKTAFGLSYIDLDLQNMLKVDLDEDWTWYLHGTVTP